jgi:glyoxalase family protein
LKEKITGLHHVTAIASDPQSNVDFYVEVLGLRLVKRTVNFDDPGTYHFYFGDALGSPGTILTFFAWAGARRGIRGTGQIEATAFVIAPESVGYWLEHLKAHHVSALQPPARFGEEVIRFTDPDGLPLELVTSPQELKVQPWPESTVPAKHSIRGFHSVSAALEGYERTAKLLTETLGYQLLGEMGNRFRFAAPEETGPGRTIDLLCMPDSQPGRVAAGSVHHIAFRARDDQEQLQWRDHLVERGYNVSPVMDRIYFRSIYFREPGGILCEIATDAPGFTLDEAIEELGSKLRLPPWLERVRTQLEGILPPVAVPKTSDP